MKMNGIGIFPKIVFPEITTREVAHKTDSKWTLYSAITNVIYFVLNYEVVREPIVSGHLTSIFQCRVSFSLRIRFRVSFRV